LLADGGLFFLVRTSPDGGGIAFPTQDIEAEFSAPLDWNTVDGGSVRLLQTWGPVDLPYRFQVGLGTLTLSPAAALPLACTFELRLGNTLSALDGARFAGQSVFFSTNDGHWSGSGGSIGFSGVSSPQVAIDDVGEPHVLFASGDTVSVTEGNAQRTILNYGHTTLTAYADMQVHLDATGSAKAIATWSEGTSTLSVRASLYRGYGGWSTSVALESQSGAATIPQSTITTAGDARVVWRQTVGTTQHIYSTALDHGTGQWQTEQQLDASDAGCDLPLIASDRGTQVLTVWQEDTNLKARMGPITGPLGAEVTVGSGLASTASPALAMNRRGEAVVGWLDNAHAAWSRRLSQAGTWGAAQKTVDTGADTLSLALDEAGVATVTWTDILNAFAARSTTTGWSSATTLNPGATYTWYPRVIVSGPNALVQWAELPGAKTARFLGPSGGWQTPVVLSSSGRTPFALGGAPSGQALSVWVEGTSSPGLVFDNFN
jgi:hypothetical protein